MNSILRVGIILFLLEKGEEFVKREKKIEKYQRREKNLFRHFDVNSMMVFWHSLNKITKIINLDML